MESNDQHLEWALNSIDDHPVFGVHELGRTLWDPHAHQQHQEDHEVDDDVGGGSEALLNKMCGNGLIEHLWSGTHDDSGREPEKQSTKAQKVEAMQERES